MRDEKGDVHVIPAWEDELHEVSAACRCCPRLVEQCYRTGRRLYVHYAVEDAH